MKRRLHHNHRSPRSLVRARQGVTTGSGDLIDKQQYKFLVPLTIGGQEFDMELDTGSSDTWVMKSGYVCADKSGNVGKLQEADCMLGTPWTPDSSFEVNKTFHMDPCYGGGRCVSGPVGTVDVTLAGLTVPQQIIGTANLSRGFVGVGQSGLLGAAFPRLTKEYPAEDVKQDTDANIVNYPSIFDHMFNHETFDPSLEKFFSIALSRDASGIGYGGSLTIGDLPDLTDPRVNVSETTPGSSSPIVLEYSEYQHYVITVDNVVVAPADPSTANLSTFAAAPYKYDTKGFTTLTDLGNDHLVIPVDSGCAFNQHWTPPIPNQKCALEHGWYVDCNATNSASLGFTIGGTTYWINSADLIGKEVDTGNCYSRVYTCSTYPCSDDLSLGDTFFNNVIAIHNWGNKMMGFYPRPYYQS